MLPREAAGTGAAGFAIAAGFFSDAAGLDAAGFGAVNFGATVVLPVLGVEAGLPAFAFAAFFDDFFAVFCAAGFFAALFVFFATAFLARFFEAAAAIFFAFFFFEDFLLEDFLATTNSFVA